MKNGLKIESSKSFSFKEVTNTNRFDMKVMEFSAPKHKIKHEHFKFYSN